MHAGTSAITCPATSWSRRWTRRASTRPSCSLPDFTYALRDGTHTIEELLDHHRMVRDRHPGRFRVFVGVDPRRGSDGLALFERAITDLRLRRDEALPALRYRLRRHLYPFYEICGENCCRC